MPSPPAALRSEYQSWRLTAAQKSTLESHIDSIEITSGRYDGLWKQTTSGKISVYFMYEAMTLAPARFTSAEILAAVAAGIDKLLVGPRQNSATYAADTLVSFSSGKIYFCNLGGTTAAAEPSDAGITDKAQTLVDGTVTWESVAVIVDVSGTPTALLGQEPTDWQWFWLDGANDLFNLLRPDSNDAYSGAAISACLAGGPDSTWLNAASAHPGYSRLEALALSAQNSITDDILHDLAWVFQGGTRNTSTSNTPSFDSYDVYFLADNVEAWRGMKALADLYAIVGDSGAETAADADAATLKTGVLSLWDSGVDRFQTYYGQPNPENLSGDSAFVSDFRFHMWPTLHGMLTGGEIATYADPVMEYTTALTPGLYTNGMDAFVMGEWYLAAQMNGRTRARYTLAHRAVTRNVAYVTITDAAVAVQAWS